MHGTYTEERELESAKREWNGGGKAFHIYILVGGFSSTRRVLCAKACKMPAEADVRVSMHRRDVSCLFKSMQRTKQEDRDESNRDSFRENIYEKYKTEHWKEMMLYAIFMLGRHVI